MPDVIFHSLRHTADWLLIEGGEDPARDRQHAGPRDTRMLFERYGHLFNHSAQRQLATTDRNFRRARVQLSIRLS